MKDTTTIWTPGRLLLYGEVNGSTLEKMKEEYTILGERLRSYSMLLDEIQVLDNYFD